MRPCLSKPIEMRGKQYGGEKGLFCLPLVAADQADLFAQARKIAAHAPDVVEWRSDFYADLSEASLAGAAAGLRRILGDALLLFTLRAKAEGGHKELAPADRQAAIEGALKTRVFDLVDVELCSGPAMVKAVIAAAHACGARVILSFHDFAETPANEVLLAKVAAMVESGADVAKFACMPRDPGDVLRVLEVTLKARRTFPTVALCSMSMGGPGCLSRVAGFQYGSDMAFALGDKSSAPGQIPIEEARSMAEALARYA